MIERQVDIPAHDGLIDTFICHPERHGPHPVVIFYMDAVGIRDELRDMARRIAAAGYYVLLPNLYYRAGPGIEPMKMASNPVHRTFQKFNPVRWVKIFKRIVELMGAINNDLIMRDTVGLLDFIDKDPAARPGPLACVGHCMSGHFVVTAAGRFPDRVVAAASFYGTDLYTDKPDSPHLLADKIKGELYIACAETDQYVPASTIAGFRAALEKAGTNFEIELYPGTRHGFAFPQRKEYDRIAAERHWERMFDLFARRLR